MVRTTKTWVGTVGALAAMVAGCAVSTEPTNGPGKAVTESPASSSEAMVIPPCYGVTPSSPNATVFMRIPDNDGCMYAANWSWTGRNYCDGHTVEFQTPWVTASWAAANGETDVYNYESQLWSYVPSSQPYEYLVKQVTLGTCSPSALVPSQNCLASYVSTRDWFSVPITTYADSTSTACKPGVPCATSIVAAYKDDSKVESALHQCVFYVDPPAGAPFPPPLGTAMKVVEFDYAADSHDPTRNPN